jgi:hypothetical protein
VERADTRLIDYIQRATQGGCMLLRTLGVRGKALERDEPERAELLLAAVRSHSLYKGGRLAFDMLELEDLMLDASSVALLNDAQLAQLLSVVAANAHSVVEAILGLGSGEGDGAAPPTSTGESVDQPPVATGAHLQTPATFLPRISFGPASDSVERSETSGRDNGRNAPEPELLSSDYLYDYVVLGFLDMLGRHICD